jgi:hypothetical protein
MKKLVEGSTAASDDCRPVPLKHEELFLNMEMIYGNGECAHERRAQEA